jgi:hypothetical protein
VVSRREAGHLSKARTARLNQPSPTFSEAANQVRNGHTERVGYSRQAVDGNVLLSALHIADVNRVQISHFRKLLLADANLLAARTDVLAEDAAVLWGVGHARSPNQDWRQLTTVYILCLAHGLLLRAVVGSRTRERRPMANQEKDMKQEVIRNRTGQRLGTINQEGDRLVARDLSNLPLGYFDPKDGYTKDKTQKIICQGNILSALVLEAAKAAGHY